MRLSIGFILLVFLIACSPHETPVEDTPEVIPFNKETLNALSDSIILQALYEVTGLLPLPDTIVTHGDTVKTIIQILTYQPFNAPFTFTRIEGNNFDNEVSLNRFLIKHDKECSFPLVNVKGSRPFDPSCYLVLKKTSIKVPQKKWKALLDLIWETDLTELAYLPRRGNLLDGDHLTYKHLEANAYEYLDFSINRGAPGERSALRMVINHLNEFRQTSGASFHMR